jgi:putative transposase
MRKPYRSDLTDAQWAIIGPVWPPAKSGGRPRAVDLREVVTTLFFQSRTGIPWEYVRSPASGGYKSRLFNG